MPFICAFTWSWHTTAIAPCVPFMFVCSVLRSFFVNHHLCSCMFIWETTENESNTTDNTANKTIINNNKCEWQCPTENKNFWMTTYICICIYSTLRTHQIKVLSILPQALLLHGILLNGLFTKTLMQCYQNSMFTHYYHLVVGYYSMQACINNRHHSLAHK